MEKHEMETLKEGTWYIKGCEELEEYFDKNDINFQGDFSTHGYYIENGEWDCNIIEHLQHRTELTYPEFIKLFEGGEVEVLQVENDYQDLKESHSELFRRLNQLRNRYKLDNLDKCLGRAKEINRKYANNKGFKIVQSDKNNVFFLDECIFTYCPTPNECKNGGCLSKSNNQ